jgi:HAD superfamily hydrolase (TIGR01484 family)
MRYLTLATDYDGTLAEQGETRPTTLAALRRLRESGRRVVLVTGRELSDLYRVLPDLSPFDRVVVENGAHVFSPESGEESLLGEPPNQALVDLLRERGVQPLSIGRVIIATWEPHQYTVLEAIKELGLELQVIFNKGAVMVLPSGVNKATGLKHALKQLAISPHNVVAVGDAENDHALLMECELGVAVQNALPMLKEHADWVTSKPRGAGVEELIDALVTTDLSELEARLVRHDIVLGTTHDGQTVSIHPYGRRILLCGTSGSGKSTLATSFLERLSEAHYQFCLVDPEGDFDALEGAIVIGDERQAPKSEDAVNLLEGSENSAIVNLLGVPLESRSAALTALVGRLQTLRSQTGRPHWIVVDEAHHMLPEDDIVLPETVLNAPQALLLITVHPERLAAQVLRQIDTVIVVGDEPEHMLRSFAERSEKAAPALSQEALEPGEAWIWRPLSDEPPLRFRSIPPKTERRRHRRKYAAGELGEDKSFFFRGADGRLNLRAHNLQLFMQMADGVDDATWSYHLGRHDYSQWVRSAIKNDGLADELEQIERTADLSASDSRRQIREAIGRVYTLPA